MARTTTIALLQLEPVFKEPLASLAKAEEMIAEVRPGQLDLLVLPELAFAGYNFHSYQDIEPYVESEVDGLSVSWAKRTATRLCCHVMIGFAQRIQSPQPGIQPADQKCFNALAIVSDQGELLKVYHKTQLYPPVDPLWAKPGEGFLRIDLWIGKAQDGTREAVKCCVGICMDLSPDQFEAPFEDFELSSFSIQEGAEMLICPMAWLDSGPRPDPHRTSLGKSWPEVGSTLTYWATRCTPMWNKHGQTFVACNRVGSEDDTVYTGTSCVISNVQEPSVTTPPKRPTVLEYASKHYPELLVTLVPLASDPS